MALAVSVSLDTAKQYANSYLSTKFNGKKHKVYMKLLCDDTTIEEGIQLAKRTPCIALIEYQGVSLDLPCLTEDTGVLICKSYSLGNNMSEQDVAIIAEDLPNGITPVIYLPEDFVNLELLHNVSRSYPRFRFCGGELFSVDGVRLGYIGIDILEKLGEKILPEYYYIKNIIDVIPSVAIEELELTVSTTKEKAPKAPKSGSSSTKTPKKTTKTMLFSDIVNKNGLVLP